MNYDKQRLSFPKHHVEHVAAVPPGKATTKYEHRCKGLLTSVLIEVKYRIDFVEISIDQWRSWQSFQQALEFYVAESGENPSGDAFQAAMLNARKQGRLPAYDNKQRKLAKARRQR